MDKVDYEPVYTAHGQLEAESIKAFLESFEIPAIIMQESVGVTYGLTIGSLGEARVCVPETMAETARDFLRRMLAGEFDADGQDASLQL